MIIVYLNEQCTKMETLSLYTCTIESWIKGINILTVNITTSLIEKALRIFLLYIFSILYIVVYKVTSFRAYPFVLIYGFSIVEIKVGEMDFYGS